jgi:uncharacterized membrane protein YkgB
MDDGIGVMVMKLPLLLLPLKDAAAGLISAFESASLALMLSPIPLILLPASSPSSMHSVVFFLAGSVILNDMSFCGGGGAL